MNRALNGVMLALAAPVALSATDADVDKLTTYAVVLGRAVGCGIDTERASSRVGAWIDRRFTPSDKSIYLPVFMMGVQENMQMQQVGKSPDTCATVRRQFSNFPWP